MKKTKFYSGRNKSIFIAEAKKGNDKACDAILAELDRLEKRIKDLESGIDLLMDYAHGSNDGEPDYNPKSVDL